MRIVIPLAVLGFVLIVFAAYLLSSFGQVYSFENYRWHSDYVKYKPIVRNVPVFASRQWVDLAIEITKEQKLQLPTTAHFISYVASVYSDVLEKTGDSRQAGIAASEVISFVAPEYGTRADLLLELLGAGEGKKLIRDGREITEVYLSKAKEEGFMLQAIPAAVNNNNEWWFGDGNFGSRMGYLRWLLPGEINFDLKPPEIGSLRQNFENEIVSEAVNKRGVDDIDRILFWVESDGATLAGIWQDILFAEISESTDENNFAKAQKILAQTIDDSSIETWKVKYNFLAPRPLMSVPNLNVVLSSKSYLSPSFVSEYASISYSAAVVLSSLFPEKEKVWFGNAQDAARASLFAGLHFDIDNKAGEYLGRKIGSEIISADGDKSSGELVFENDQIKGILGFLSFRFGRFANNVYGRTLKFTSEIKRESKLKFTEISEQEIFAYGAAGGVSWGDFDNDGLEDMFLGKRGLFKNVGNGIFEDVTSKSGVQSPVEFAFGGLWGDFDNDGCLDLYVSTSGDSFPNDSIFRNNCDGTFTDMTETAGINNRQRARGVAFSDFNNDGFLDIYVVNAGVFKSIDDFTVEPNRLFRNNGDWTFIDVAKDAGVTGEANCPGLKESSLFEWPDTKLSFQPVWFDYNDDGFQDLFVATDGGISPLYKNLKDESFEDVTRSAGLCVLATGMGVTVGDFDNSGRQSIYVTNVGANFLWKNNGDGTFTEIAKTLGVEDDGIGWATEFFDFDNDGFLDIYLVNGVKVTDSSGKIREGNKKAELYKNSKNKKFLRVAESLRMDNSDPNMYGTVADFDNNGFFDVVIVSQDAENKGRVKLFKNAGNGNNWISIKLVGTKSNRGGVGAKIRVEANGRIQMAQVVSGSSFISQKSLTQIFGIGHAYSVDRIEVKWPSGAVQELRNISANKKILIVEED